MKELQEAAPGDLRNRLPTLRATSSAYLRRKEILNLPPRDPSEEEEEDPRRRRRRLHVGEAHRTDHLEEEVLLTDRPAEEVHRTDHLEEEEDPRRRLHVGEVLRMDHPEEGEEAEVAPPVHREDPLPLRLTGAGDILRMMEEEEVTHLMEEGEVHHHLASLQPPIPIEVITVVGVRILRRRLAQTSYPVGMGKELPLSLILLESSPSLESEAKSRNKWVDGYGSDWRKDPPFLTGGWDYQSTAKTKCSSIGRLGYSGSGTTSWG